jgi:sugar O-acyltransferase (sialic acid O-acetyltransferase NeuD family)
MRVLVVGAGGHGRVVADVILEAGLATELAFVDDRFPALSHSGPWPVVGTNAELPGLRDRYDAFALGIGSWKARSHVWQTLDGLGVRTLTAVHPRATVSRHAQLGEGTVVCAGAAVVIGAELGRGCIVNTGATVDHDCRLEDWVHVCPGAHLSGDVHVGQGSWIGAGSVVRQGIRIGEGVTIGVGAACVSDMPPGVVAVGVPARAVRRD